ncbi:amidohydrolase [Sphingobium fluviale]|uniref:Amidohydrolase n=2 Tax=Sphingobium fluviale TaxID=2506423 RepID=A0A4Q1KGW8_9SPHN|nr:amidohydrolase [Sphingobium fluviale]
MTYEPAITKPQSGDPATYDLVIRRAHVFDGHKALNGLYDIAVMGGEIAAVSASPIHGAKEIDAAEGWVMPGLIDSHIHFYNVFAVSDPASMDAFEENELPGRLDSFLQYGVTTIKSVGDPTSGILATRAKIASGQLRGPRLLATGCGVTGRDGHPAATIFSKNPWARARFAGEVGTVQEMRDLIHYLADMKVDAIKILSEGACACHSDEKYVWQIPGFLGPFELERLPLDMLQAGIETAHERGLRATVHTAQQDVAREAIEAGADALEHGVMNEPITDDSLIQLMIDRDVMFVPTLYAHGEAHPELVANVKKVSDAGVGIALGTDTFAGKGIYGENTLAETELMVAAGMTPLQSLVAGTSAAAKQCERADLGVVEPGKRADLLLLSADPTENISNVRKLRKVILNGEIVVEKD